MFDPEEREEICRK
ncbi:hypothetical protein RDABS01_029940 [Bienertia sinuspersici]